MIISILFIVLGIVLLYLGGDWLVKGASRLALHWGISPLIIGLTVVSFGTSAPELVASLMAQLTQHSGSVAVGNVIGSNIFNIGLVLGLSALILPVSIHAGLFKRELPICIGASLMMVLMMSDDSLSRIDGGVLLICFIAYLAFQGIEARRSKATAEALAAELEDYTGHIQSGSATKLWSHLLLIVAGSGLLVLGADFLVKHAIELSRMIGISERVIGLTAVAFGTSLPELATSLVAAFRKESDIAVGNVVGSNIFNIFLIIGSVAVISPLSYDPILLSRDGPFMLALTGLMVGLLWFGKNLRRWEGALLLGAVLTYMGLVFFY